MDTATLRENEIFFVSGKPLVNYAETTLRPNSLWCYHFVGTEHFHHKQHNEGEIAVNAIHEHTTTLPSSGSNKQKITNSATSTLDHATKIFIVYEKTFTVTHMFRSDTRLPSAYDGTAFDSYH